jgi:hypothetical protein
MVDIAKVTPPETYGGPVIGSTDDGGVPIGLLFTGAPGAAPPNSSVIVTNLDSTDAPFVTTARENGSFVVGIQMDLSDELRFEAITASGRTPPSDGKISDAPETALRAASRHACLSLEPGFSLDVTGQNTASLVLRNQCDGAVELDDARFRTEGAEFTLLTTLPLEVPSQQSTTLEFAHVPASGSASEVVLFVDVTLSGETLRYPITLYANAR